MKGFRVSYGKLGQKLVDLGVFDMAVDGGGVLEVKGTVAMMEVKNTLVVTKVNGIMVVVMKVNGRVVAVMDVNSKVGWSSVLMERWWLSISIEDLVFSFLMMKILDEDGEGG
ncbi:hypothetical protein QVD17_41519 [Tagetes erecta]|uniref:Uncharacterized protein n=1 Tax=Tagetes erecta TaxID=13708 RepID=A0AAD8N8X2_TARER|nr:hypothetical protein QVD17_41519 [Tagetes erecta]